MKNYYLVKPLMCLFCGNPYNRGGRVRVSDRKWECGECEVSFSPVIPISQLGNLSDIMDAGTTEIPLVWWQQKLNSIEIAYSEWLIGEHPEGKFFIIWPWDDVRFLPVLISEYLLANPESRVAVVTNIKDKIMRGDFPSLEEKLRNLAYIPVTDCLNYEDVLDKKTKIKRLNRHMYPRIFNVRGSRPIKELSQIGYPLKAIYPQKSIWNYLVNYNRIIWFADVFPCVDNRYNRLDFRAASEKAPKIVTFGKRLILINSKLERDNIIQKTKEFRPELVILDGKGLQLLDSDWGAKTILDFSTIPKYRSSNILHKLRIPRDITIHSLDNHIVTGKDGILPKVLETDLIDPRRWGELFSPLSNHASLIHKKSYQTNIEYCSEPELENFGNYFQQFCNLIDDSGYSKDLSRFLFFAMSSPLDLIKTDTTIETCYELAGSDCSFGIILNTIDVLKQRYPKYEASLEEFKKALIERFIRNNPLKIRLLSKLKELLADPNNRIYILVYPNEIKKLGVLLERSGLFQTEDLERITIIPWKLLELNIKRYGKGLKNIVISFVTPYRWMYCPDFEKVIFICSEKKARQIKASLDGGIFDGLFPIIPIEPQQSIPPAVRPLLDVANFPTPLTDTNFVFCSTYEGYVLQTDTQQNSNLYESSVVIKAGEECYLVETEGNGIFLPSQKHILIYDEDNLFPILIEEMENDPMKYVGFRILYHSDLGTILRKLFYEFMLQNDYPISYQSRREGHLWRDFNELYEAATKWLRALKETIQKIVSKSKVTEDEAEKIIIEKLINAGIHQDPGYVLREWVRAKFDEAETDFGMREIFNIERPMNNQSMVSIYTVLYQYIAGNFSALDADRDYSAVEMLQNVRSQLLFKDLNVGEGNIQQDYHDFLLNSLKQKNQLEGIPVKSIKKVRLTSEVKAFKPYEQWQDYINQ